MKLSEAVVKMVVGETFSAIHYLPYNIKKVHETSIVWMDENQTELKIVDIINYGECKGEIIPAEPNILTADEVLMHFYPLYKEGLARSIIISYGQAMHQNGRLEMWLEFKNFYENGLQYSGDLRDAIEQLKPK